MPGRRRLLILGGGGMVGIQVAREAARKLPLSHVVISALTAAEVDETMEVLKRENEAEGWGITFTGAPADIFVRGSMQGIPRPQLIADRQRFDELFADIFTPEADAYRESMLFQLLDEHKPDLVVDCINTATAISYQDVFTISRRVKLFLDEAETRGSVAGEELSRLGTAVRELLIAQGVPQIVRHILFLHRSLEESSVSMYVKVGTTGTGGMGVNIPFTHSEDRPSATLLSKSAVGFAHTGLLFLLARTPRGGSGAKDTRAHGPIVKEVKPGAMIGFKRLGLTHVKVSGASGKREPAFLVSPRDEQVGQTLRSRESFEDYGRFENRDIPLQIVGADTGENGFFSIGEFQAITYPRLMEYVTPEEVARLVVLEILGSSTGRDVISAIDGAITEPSYRAGVIRSQAIEEMGRLETMLAAEGALPSIAVGHLGPPRLSKLLIEAFLIREALESASLETLGSVEPEEMRRRVEGYLEANPRIVSLVVTIGIPFLRQREGAQSLTRGPRLNIPVPAPDGSPLPLEPRKIEEYAASGWVDLRVENFALWRDRIQRVAGARPDIVEFGSAAFDRTRYLPEKFVPGDFVGWLLANERDALGMVGHRLF